ncbi:hypothetical protein [Senegalia sp. (in: firmicutes)]|uniref:hypothetical protein n=1 Tax=Senegalia sp. (in: firmicutes) TaxID=1924098 RepID=UPI003F9CE8AF
MKKTGLNFTKVIRNTCNILIAASPLILTQSSSFLLWGESQIPEILKKDIKNQ